MTDNLARQRVLNFLEVYYSGDIDGALARCTDDIEFIANAPIDILPHMGHRSGKQALGEMWRTIHARYSDMRHEMPILVAEATHHHRHRAFFRKRNNRRVVQFDIAAFYTFATATSRRSPEIIDTFDA
jgi:ketosteroid isomerase-like protein